MSKSFSQSAKDEICQSGKFNRTCCKRAMLYGMVLFSSHYNTKKYKLTATNLLTAKKLVELANDICGVELSIGVGQARLDEQSYVVSCEDEQAKALYEEFDNIESQPSLRINYAVFDCDICKYAFITGAFLASGTVTSPDKAYHLEFISSHLARSKDLLELIKNIDDNVHIVSRNSMNVVYIKESAFIEDILTIMGAKNSVFDIMNTKIVKDIRNRANRAVNCETANISKTITASVEQIDAINLLSESGKLLELDEQLQSVAMLRLENEDLSLNELALLTNPPLNKSTLNRKLKKLVQLAKT